MLPAAIKAVSPGDKGHENSIAFYVVHIELLTSIVLSPSGKPDAIVAAVLHQHQPEPVDERLQRRVLPNHPVKNHPLRLGHQEEVFDLKKRKIKRGTRDSFSNHIRSEAECVDFRKTKQSSVRLVNGSIEKEVQREISAALR